MSNDNHFHSQGSSRDITYIKYTVEKTTKSARNQENHLTTNRDQFHGTDINTLGRKLVTHNPGVGSNLWPSQRSIPIYTSNASICLQPQTETFLGKEVKTHRSQLMWNRFRFCVPLEQVLIHLCFPHTHTHRKYVEIYLGGANGVLRLTSDKHLGGWGMREIDFRSRNGKLIRNSMYG